ncbi:MAG: class I SAM-dependent methyltransferase [Anaerolineaceae bacterium]
MNQQNIGAKPVGKIGILAGLLMNLIHQGQYSRIIREIPDRVEDPVNAILDIGCGGGIALKEFAKVYQKARFFGIDYSQDMVVLSRSTNRRECKSGRVEILNASVEDMQFQSDSIDIATAFDNISFWEDYEAALREIKRVLRKGGKFFIINGFPPVGSKWYQFVRIKNEEGYENLLSQNGFKVNRITVEKQTIFIESENSLD